MQRDMPPSADWVVIDCMYYRFIISRKELESYRVQKDKVGTLRSEYNHWKRVERHVSFSPPTALFPDDDAEDSLVDASILRFVTRVPRHISSLIEMVRAIWRRRSALEMKRSERSLCLLDLSNA